MNFKEKLNSIFMELADSLGCKKEDIKTEIEDSIKEIEKFLNLFFEQKGFKVGVLDEKALKISYSLKVEYADLTKRLTLVKKNHSFALLEGCQLCHQNLKTFPFGYIKEFNLNKFASFEVSFSGDIRDKETKEFLASKGILFENNSILATDKNVLLIENMLIKEFQAKGIEIFARNLAKSNNFVIREIQCKIKPENLITYQFKEAKPVHIQNPKELGFDEITDLQECLISLYNAYEGILDKELAKAHSDCFQIIESSFCQLCKGVNIQNSITELHEKAWRELRNLSKESTKKKEELASYISATTLQDTFCKLVNRLESHFVEEYGFYLKEAFVTPYRAIRAVLSYNLEPDITDEKLKEMYECVGTTLEDYDLFILSNDTNLQRLEAKIKKDFRQSELTSIETKRKNNSKELVIREIELNLNLEDFIKV